MKHKEPKAGIEHLSVLLMNRLLAPQGLVACYLGTGSALDFQIREGNAEVGGGDITADTDPGTEAFRSHVFRNNHAFPLALGQGEWYVGVDGAIDLRELRRKITRATSILSDEGISSIRLQEDWALANRLGLDIPAAVSTLEKMGRDTDRMLVIGPIEGGVIDSRPELLSEYMSRVCQRPTVAKRVAKLKDIGDERHLVVIPNRPGEEFSLTYRMNGWGSWPGLPTTRPDIPESVTDIWLAQPAVGHMVRWSRRGGWSHLPPLGTGWWRAHTDIPEIDFLATRTR